MPLKTLARGIMLATLACASTMANAFAQQSEAWNDPSPHSVRFISVEDGVRLEVLDWGGTGRPVVLLAGYLTAHAYDEFAPKLANFCHVYGITRRGYGASSRAASGYTAQRSADDVLRVLDALKLSAPVLAGHSFGGQDLSTIGAQHSGRVAGLVYLNSAEDPTLVLSDYGVVPPVDRSKLPAALRTPASPDFRSFQAYRDWQLRTHGVAFPESELRQMYVANADGTMGEYRQPKSTRDAIFAGRMKPDYSRIRVPVLALFATPPPIEDQIARYQPRDAEERAAMEGKRVSDVAISRRHIRDLQQGVPSARVIEFPRANFYIFLSNETDVLREMRAFLTGLGPPANR